MLNTPKNQSFRNSNLHKTLPGCPSGPGAPSLPLAPAGPKRKENNLPLEKIL